MSLPINSIVTGDCLEVMRGWPDGCVQCVVTSPPYWGLRDYGTATWEGGDAECDHLGKPMPTRVGFNERYFGRESSEGNKQDALREPYKETCGKCGARRQDQQLGLEPTPEAYVSKMVEVFREVKRVLRDDGTLWLNLGDSYNGSGGYSGDHTPSAKAGSKQTTNKGSHKKIQSNVANLKPKDLCGIPWRVAFALQADGWYLRQDIIWAKPNPMPESCTDRCTKAHEMLFLLTKKPRYFYDQEAIKEPSQDKAGRVIPEGHTSSWRMGNQTGRITERDGKSDGCPSSGRNKRSVWTVTTQSCPDAHFATFPEKLIEPCILAGTSKKGACPECGSPWERVVEKEQIKRERKTDVTRPCSDRSPSANAVAGVDTKTTGWRPTCRPECSNTGTLGPYDTIPCVVCDPFSGAGTVAVVAARLGRDYIGTELNPEYVRIAERRIGAVTTGVPVKEARKGQMPLW